MFVLTDHMSLKPASCPYQMRVAKNSDVALEVYDAADNLAEKAQAVRELRAALRKAEDAFYEAEKRSEAAVAKAAIVASLEAL